MGQIGILKWSERRSQNLRDCRVIPDRAQDPVDGEGASCVQLLQKEKEEVFLEDGGQAR